MKPKPGLDQTLVSGRRSNITDESLKMSQLPGFLDRSKVKLKQAINSKSKSQTLLETVDFKKRFVPSRPLLPFKNFEEPPIPKFALKLVHTLHPEMWKKNQNAKEEEDDHIGSNILTRSPKNTGTFRIDPQQLSKVENSGKKFQANISLSRSTSQKILKNSGSQNSIIAKKSPATNIPATENSKNVRASQDVFELSSQQLEINKTMLKLDSLIVKFLELSENNPEKYKMIEAVSRSLKAKSPLFSAFSEEFISEMLYISSIRFYDKGQVVFY